MSSDARPATPDEDGSVGAFVRHARDVGADVLARGGFADEAGSASGGTLGTSTGARGVEMPHEVADAIPHVTRAFAFVDLCGFTSFTAHQGEHAAIETVTQFRALTRALVTRRGVRVAKWLGDGAMIVGVEIGPTIATAAELIARYADQPLALRGGVAHGEVLIIDGDDYIGRPTNLASRLCDAAQPGELLSVGYRATLLPPWIRVLGSRQLTLPGLGRVRRAQQLGLADDVSLPALVPPARS
jgi:class 3 adenylate cyclase